MNPNKTSACGLLFCYNEESIIAETIKYYLNQGIDLVIFDNQSNDSSINIINSFSGSKGRYPAKILEVVSIASQGYDWEAILHKANDYMHNNLNHYEWILIIDADTHFSSPLRDISLLEYLAMVKRRGYNIIHARIYNFYPTDKDDYSVTSYSERIKYFQTWNVFPQEKIFLYHHSVNFYSRYAHWCLRYDRRVCVNPGVIARHYLWVSYEQGLKKIFNDRKPRYIKAFPSQPQYAYLLPLKKCLIKDSRQLKYFNERKETISVARFLCLTRIIFMHEFIFAIAKEVSTFLKNLVENGSLPKNNLTDMRDSSARESPGSNTTGLPGKIIKLIRKSVATVLPEQYKRFIRLLRPYYISPIGRNYTFTNIIDRFIPPSLNSEILLPGLSYPSEYHFLMTNFCNAKCIFCNQLENNVKNEITLEKLKLMLSHITMDEVKRFYFSGGGEPLLSRELFDILRHVNNCFPGVKIRLNTNGLLIEKYAADLAKLELEQLIISVHGRKELNDFLLQTKNSESIFNGLALLNKYQQDLKKKTYKVFYIAVSRINLDEVPALIEKASELKVDEVSVQHCRYFTHRIGRNLKAEDSLWFHKDMYNRVINKSAKLARKLGVHFNHSPLFSKKFKEQRCCAPWDLLLVDGEGDVFPCTGGEACFYKKVKSQQYKFGNLLKEHLTTFWFNEFYTKLRRHILGFHSEKYIPECENCHNTFCFKGPDLKESHIIASPGTS